MQQVVKSLRAIIFEENNETNPIYHTENEMELSQQITSIEEMIYMHSDNSISCMFSKNSELFLSKLYLDNEYIPDILNQAEKLFLEIFNIVDNIKFSLIN